MPTNKISDHISNIKSYTTDISSHRLTQNLSNPKLKNLLFATLFTLYPAGINNSNDHDSWKLDDHHIQQVQDPGHIEQDSTYEHDVDPDFSTIDLSGITPNTFFTKKVFELEDSLSSYHYHKKYDLNQEYISLQDKIPSDYHNKLQKHPNKVRADLLMWYIDKSYKLHYDQLQSIYNILWVWSSYRYPIFQKLNIIFDNYSKRHFGSKDIYIYDKRFYQLLYDKILKSPDFRKEMMIYIHQFEKTYRALQNKASTNLQFVFDDSSSIKNYDIKFDNGYYTLPTRLDHQQVWAKFDEIWVDLYSSAEFDKAIWNRYGYYDISTHGMSPLIPEFLDLLQQDLSKTFPSLDIWGKDKLIVRGGTEYSHSDYFISINKKTIPSKKKWSKPVVTTTRDKMRLFDYKEGELADVKKRYKIDHNTIDSRYIDKIITKHQFGYSIDIQSRWQLGVALSSYLDVWSTAYNFKNRNKIAIKQYWPGNNITALFSYHDNHFHILVIPTDLYHKIKGKIS